MFQGIIAKLNVQSNGFIWGYVLYLIIFLDILTLILQKQSNIQITVFISISVMAALIDKIDAFPRGDFWAFFIRVLIFVFPLVVAGMTRTPRSRPWAILCAIIAGIYMFARWFIDQMPR